MSNARVRAGFDPSNAGGLIPIVKKTASGQLNIDFTEFDPAVYEAYTFNIQNLNSNVEPNIPQLRLSSDGGLTYWDGGDDYGRQPNGGSKGTTDHIRLGGSTGIATGEVGMSGIIHVLPPASPALSLILCDLVYQNIAGARSFHRVEGTLEKTEAINGLRLYLNNGGNFVTGSITMYGIRKAA